MKYAQTDLLDIPIDSGNDGLIAGSWQVLDRWYVPMYAAQILWLTFPSEIDCLQDINCSKDKRNLCAVLSGLFGVRSSLTGAAIADRCTGDSTAAREYICIVIASAHMLLCYAIG